MRCGAVDPGIGVGACYSSTTRAPYYYIWVGRIDRLSRPPSTGDLSRRTGWRGAKFARFERQWFVCETERSRSRDPVWAIIDKAAVARFASPGGGAVMARLRPSCPAALHVCSRPPLPSASRSRSRASTINGARSTSPRTSKNRRYRAITARLRAAVEMTARLIQLGDHRLPTNPPRRRDAATRSMRARGGCDGVAGTHPLNNLCASLLDKNCSSASRARPCYAIDHEVRARWRIWRAAAVDSCRRPAKHREVARPANLQRPASAARSRLRLLAGSTSGQCPAALPTPPEASPARRPNHEPRESRTRGSPRLANGHRRHPARGKVSYEECDRVDLPRYGWSRIRLGRPHFHPCRRAFRAGDIPPPLSLMSRMPRPLGQGHCTHRRPPPSSQPPGSPPCCDPCRERCSGEHLQRQPGRR